MNISIIQMEAKDLIEKMYIDASEDDLFDFIKALDARVSDYDFTNRLKNYFVEEIRKEDDLEKAAQP